ncbi:hypothetical protein GCM10025862_26650 [Arsenicicoccus piscis]|uniref:Molybdopterin cofactor biosynthesis C (MoaC) domain-containing protein n=1 Tax=Arsenicicoccus piscis TaxID=673954 RepID=A0ABQ6HSY2_9MICO|nr:hypothetical protein GCM10025862_26650 [Arsenicicoccus piscis]
MTDDPQQPRLTHVRADGSAHMVDITAKEVTARSATASGRVLLAPSAIAALRDGTVPKGDALAVARIAGIQAVKRTPSSSRSPTRSRCTGWSWTWTSSTTRCRSARRCARPTAPGSRWKP